VLRRGAVLEWMYYVVPVFMGGPFGLVIRAAAAQAAGAVWPFAGIVTPPGPVNPAKKSPSENLDSYPLRLDLLASSGTKHLNEGSGPKHFVSRPDVSISSPHSEHRNTDAEEEEEVQYQAPPIPQRRPSL